MPTRFRRALLPIAAVALAPLLAFHRAPPTLQIKLFTFAPKTVTVAAGDTLLVTNGDDTEHTVTFGTPDNKDARLTGAVLGKGGTAAVTPRTPGVYPFYCERHPFMTGTLTVTAH
jgi:plastocyanin